MWVRLSWLPSKDAKFYDIYYSKDPELSREKAFRVARAKSGRYVAPLQDGIPYYFMVVAVNEHGQSAASFVVSATPAASAPIEVTFRHNPGERASRPVVRPAFAGENRRTGTRGGLHPVLLVPTRTLCPRPAISAPPGSRSR